jgi:hypothetical protein
MFCSGRIVGWMYGCEVSRIVTKIKRPKEDVMNRLPRFVSGLSLDMLPLNELADRARYSVSDRRMDVSMV